MRSTEKIITEKDTIWIDENNFVRIELNNGHEFNEKDILRQFDSYSKLGIGINNKGCLLADALTDFTITKGAREIIAEKASGYFSACAVISNSLATRILLIFFNSHHPLPTPVQMFKDKNLAVNWIKKFDRSSKAA